MSMVYDDWERLVGAVLKREELRRIALLQSFSSSISTGFSFDYSLEDVLGASSINKAFNPAASSSQNNFSYHNVQPIEFTEIEKATGNFQPDMLLGGGFGRYFKAWLDKHTLTASMPGSGMPVAVKKWYQESQQGHLELLEEINYMSQLHHPSLVKLIGYCSKEDIFILVYEFMPNGSLENHLFTREHESLSWETRIKVAIGAARGLSFLHEMETPVLHGSFTSAAILLDEEFNAKLSDICLTGEDPFPNVSEVLPRVMGYGYAAPEYIATGELTTKYDVFGFGIFLLELLSGRRVLDRTQAMEEQNLVEWAKKYLSDKRKLLRIVDTRLEGQYTDDEAYAVTKLAFQCIRAQPKKRPRVAEVVVALEQLECLKTK